MSIIHFLNILIFMLNGMTFYFNPNNYSILIFLINLLVEYKIWRNYQTETSYNSDFMNSFGEQDDTPNYDDMTLKELREEAKDKIQNYDKLSKKDLILELEVKWERDNQDYDEDEESDYKFDENYNLVKNVKINNKELSDEEKDEILKKYDKQHQIK